MQPGSCGWWLHVQLQAGDERCPSGLCFGHGALVASPVTQAVDQAPTQHFCRGQGHHGKICPHTGTWATEKWDHENLTRSPRPSARCCTWPRAIPESWIHPGWKRPSDLSVWCHLPGCSHTSRTAFGCVLGLSRARALSQQGWPESSTPSLCLCPCGPCPGMSLQQKVPERAQGQRVSPLQALLLQCIEIFPVLEWADGYFLVSPKKKWMVRYYLRIFLKLSLAGGYLQGEAATINPMMPPQGLCVFQHSWAFLTLLK